MKRKLSCQSALSESTIEQDVRRVDLILRDVDHLGCSYEGRVFFNNKRAGARTKPTKKSGYAGSFFIFGHGDCYGAPDHCEIRPQNDPYKTNTLPPENLPAEVHLTVTDAFKRATKKGNKISITIVPIVCDPPDYVSADPKDALSFRTASIAIYS